MGSGPLLQLTDLMTRSPQKKKRVDPRGSGKAWIIVTDSEYVVKGMTEWLPAWKVGDSALAPVLSLIQTGKRNNLRTGRNTKLANLELFLQLDATIAVGEAYQDVKIGFWKVPRTFNTLSDALAKSAARLSDPQAEIIDT